MNGRDRTNMRFHGTGWQRLQRATAARVGCSTASEVHSAFSELRRGHWTRSWARVAWRIYILRGSCVRMSTLSTPRLQKLSSLTDTMGLIQCHTAPFVDIVVAQTGAVWSPNTRYARIWRKGCAASTNCAMVCVASPCRRHARTSRQAL